MAIDIRQIQDDLPAPALPAVTVDLTPKPVQPVMVDGALVTAPPEGDAMVNFNPGMSPVATDIPFDANLVEFLAPSDLTKLNMQIEEWVAADDKAREPWYTTYINGLKDLGITGPIIRASEPFKGASTAVYPLIMTSVLQETSRTIMEIFPPTGPVKTMVFGDETEESRARADRVADFENYTILTQDTTFRDELEQTLIYRALAGSAFKKIYYDRDKETPVSKFVKPDDLLLPYFAKSLDGASRITHRFTMSQDEMRAQVEANFYYRDTDAEPSVTQPTETQALTDAMDGKKKVIADGDEPHTVHECCSKWKLTINGVRDKKPAPYIITTIKGTNEVIAIRRNWKEGDAKMRARDRFVQYKLLPGLGVYGMGYLHLLGANQTTANGIIRALLDAAAREIGGGGVKAKGAGKIGKSITVKIGEYPEVDATLDELSKMFFTFPVPKPSEMMFKLLEPIVESSKALSSSTDVTVGDANNNAPVGTTLALIEQAHKVYTAIQGRTHAAAGKEYKIRAEINRERLPANGEYPYDQDGLPRTIMASDYQSVNILPVSDPNIYSSAQRIAQVQALLQLAEKFPAYFKLYEILRRMLDVLKVPDIDKVLLDPDKIQRMDVVTENMALVTGKPVAAFPDQDHQAHHVSHQDFLQGLPPEMQQQVGSAIQAHIAEHIALDYRNQMMAATGISMPPVNLQAQAGEEISPELPPEMENQIALAVAHVIAAMQQQQAGAIPGQPPAPAQPDPATVDALHAKDAGHVQDMLHREEAHGQEMQHAADKGAMQGVTA